MMNKIVLCLLTLLFSLSSPAMERNADFWRSTLAAKAGGSALEQALARAKPVGDRLEAVLDDGSKVIFRRDVGSKAHPLPGYPKPTDHWNIEVHKPIPGRPGRFEPAQNTHIVLDPSGKPIDIIHTK